MQPCSTVKDKRIDAISNFFFTTAQLLLEYLFSSMLLLIHSALFPAEQGQCCWYVVAVTDACVRGLC